METFECFLFAWSGQPKGGCGDLLMCCTTTKIGIEEASKLSSEYDYVHLMRCDGAKIVVIDDKETNIIPFPKPKAT